MISYISTISLLDPYPTHIKDLHKNGMIFSHTLMIQRTWPQRLSRYASKSSRSRSSSQPSNSSSSSLASLFLFLTALEVVLFLGLSFYISTSEGTGSLSSSSSILVPNIDKCMRFTAISISEVSTYLLILSLAWAVASLIMVSSDLTVTG